MKRILLTGFLFTAGLGVYGEANAACTPETGYNKVFKTVDIPMAVGRVVVRPTDE
ncbi:fimbrial protein, partial [Acinetobacter baumannii]